MASEHNDDDHQNDDSDDEVDDAVIPSCSPGDGQWKYDDDDDDCDEGNVMKIMMLMLIIMMVMMMMLMMIMIMMVKIMMMMICLQTTQAWCGDFTLVRRQTPAGGKSSFGDDGYDACDDRDNDSNAVGYTKTLLFWQEHT